DGNRSGPEVVMDFGGGAVLGEACHPHRMVGPREIRIDFDPAESGAKRVRAGRGGGNDFQVEAVTGVTIAKRVKAAKAHDHDQQQGEEHRAGKDAYDETSDSAAGLLFLHRGRALWSMYG